MSCLNDIMSVIPERISSAIAAVANRYRIKELRLRVGKPVILRSDKGEILVDSEGRESVASKALTITEKEIREVIDRVSRFSVYAFSGAFGDIWGAVPLYGRKLFTCENSSGESGIGGYYHTVYLSFIIDAV